MEFYSQYEMMKPYIGKKYGTEGFPSLLLIGESHYLPEKSIQHLNPEIWYQATSKTLSPEEIRWISTNDIVLDACKNNFEIPAYSIWANSFKEINENGPRFPESRIVGDYVVFYNYYLRPAIKGKSLKVCSTDIAYANQAFRMHLSTYQPSAIIFLSALAYKYANISKNDHVPITVTPHPGCAWWNRSARKYGNKRGRDILAEFIRNTKWPIGQE